jgi:hypothetical protein
VSCGSYITTLPAPLLPRDGSFYTSLHVGLSRNPQLKSSSSHPPHEHDLRRRQGRSREEPLGFAAVPGHARFLPGFSDGTSVVQLWSCVCARFGWSTRWCYFWVLTDPTLGLLTGNVDSEGNVNGRFNHGWTPGSVTKVQAQVWTTVDPALRGYMLMSRLVEPTGWS